MDIVGSVSKAFDFYRSSTGAVQFNSVVGAVNVNSHISSSISLNLNSNCSIIADRVACSGHIYL